MPLTDPLPQALAWVKSHRDALAAFQWRVMPDQGAHRVRPPDGSIRCLAIVDGYSVLCCPLSVTAPDGPISTLGPEELARLHGLPLLTAYAITGAADDDEDKSPIRSALLEACGLRGERR